MSVSTRWLPLSPAAAPGQNFTAFSASAVPVRKKIAVAVLATTFVGFVAPQPVQAATFAQYSTPVKAKAVQSAGVVNAPFVAPRIVPPFTLFSDHRKRLSTGLHSAWLTTPGFIAPVFTPFGQFSEPLRAKAPQPVQQPNQIFAVLPPVLPPYVGFASFSDAWHAKPSICYLFSDFKFAPPVIVFPDTHDLVFMADDRKRKKRKRYDPAKEEQEQKRLRREAIELALYGPIVEYTLPEFILPPRPAPMLDIGNLPQIIMAAKQAQLDQLKAQEIIDDENDIENILKDIL